MGASCSTTSKKMKLQGCESDKELLRRIRELQGEMMVERERQRLAYERKMQGREAEWYKERRVLEEQVMKLRTTAERKTGNNTQLESRKLAGAGMDTAERWKKLYNEIKIELDDLIQRTHNSGLQLYLRHEDVNMVQDLKRELTGKDIVIQALKAKVVAMEKEESKKAREVEILRQSLRIIMNNSKMSETKSLSRLQKVTDGNKKV